MIENIRKYTGLMIVVLVLLFFGLVFLDGGASKFIGAKPMMSVDGQAISTKEFHRQSTRAIELPRALAGRPPLPQEAKVIASHYLGDQILKNDIINSNLVPAQLLGEMNSFLQADPQRPDRFLAHRIAVRNAGLEYGVTPGEEEVDTFIEKVLFVDAEGNPDREAIDNFVKNKVSAVGGTSGFRNYIRDLLTAQNLARLLGGDLAPEMETMRAEYDSLQQKIDVKQVTLKTEDYEAESTPTEEELKEYFAENGDKYNSDEKRKVSYVYIQPDWDAALVKAEKDRAVAEEARKKKEAEEALKKMESGETDEVEKERAANAERLKNLRTAADKVAADANRELEEAEKPTEGSETETEGDEPAGIEGDPGQEGEPAPAPEGEEEAAEVSEETPVEEETAETTPVDPAPQENPVTPPQVTTTPATPTPGAPNKPAVPETPKSAKDQLTPAEKKVAVQGMIPKSNEFFQKLIDNRGEDFEEHAQEAGYEVVTTDFFTQAEPPEPIGKSIPGSSVGTIVKAVFLLPTSGDPDEKLSNPYQTDEGIFIGRFEDIVESVPLTFEEARAELMVDVRRKKARAKVAKKANELHEKLVAAIDSGKSFEDAAKELELEVTDSKDLAQGQTMNFGAYGTQKMPDPPEFEAAKLVEPGKIAPVKYVPDEENVAQALIVFVENRDLAKDNDYQEGLEQRFQAVINANRRNVLDNWLYEEFENNKVEVYGQE